MAKELCQIGTIVAAHGIRGALRVQSHSDIPERFSRLATVLVGRDEVDAREMQVTAASEDGARVLLELSECADRDHAEQLVGMKLFITDEQMEAPPEGRYFVHDLIGCRVETPAGEKRGKVQDVMLMPANDIYVVDYRGFEVLIPAVPAFIRSVDTDAKRIVVEDVSGLFEEHDED
ncbi:MAG: 16S rRNA processing protein RimM [Ignavibacteria bacterium]|nr:MAG: 16S rRNA processing protein RimM [Ignavibacteria bacterium]